MLVMVPADYRTIADFLFLTARRFPDRLAVVDDDGAHTYEELAADASAFGRALKHLGAGAGDRVVVHLPNTADFLRSHFGILWAGGVSVPVESAAAPESVAAIARAAGARWVVAPPPVVSRLEQVLAGDTADITVLSSAVVPRGQWDSSAEGSPCDPRDLACLLFTTGSTARPKGVPLRHENVCAAIENLVSLIGYTEWDREVIVLPLAHSFGLGHVYCNFRVGGAVRLFEGMSKVGRVLKALREFGATGFPGTPLGFGLLLDRYLEPFREAARHLRFIVVNSAPLPAPRAQQLMAYLPDTTLYVYYGLTEASRSTMLALNGLAPERLTSVGRAMPRIDVRIDGHDGSPVPAGTVGQVTIAGPTVPGTYWADAEATAEGYRNGRVLTGDLGYLDAEGYLFITGRIKDQINLGGTKVAGAEVESVLREHPDVEDCAVLGMPSQAGLESEVIVACVVLRPGSVFEASALQGHVRNRLEPYKVPAEIYRFDRIPRAVTGKVLRPETRVMAAAARGAM